MVERSVALIVVSAGAPTFQRFTFELRRNLKTAIMKIISYKLEMII